MGSYSHIGIIGHENITGDRHPRSVIKCHQSVEKLHPTQKPVDLWLIKTYTNENDLVLDFCMGSGTTIEAAIKSKRNYIGIEKDAEIFEPQRNVLMMFYVVKLKMKLLLRRRKIKIMYYPV